MLLKEQQSEILTEYKKEIVIRRQKELYRGERKRKTFGSAAV